MRVMFGNPKYYSANLDAPPNMGYSRSKHFFLTYKYKTNTFLSLNLSLFHPFSLHLLVCIMHHIGRSVRYEIPMSNWGRHVSCPDSHPDLPRHHLWFLPQSTPATTHHPHFLPSFLTSLEPSLASLHVKPFPLPLSF